MSRLRTNFISGTLSDGLLDNASGVTMNSAGLASLPTVASPDTAAVVLDPQAVNGAPEIVIITTFTNGQTTATVTRAQEGTAKRAHLTNEFWIHAPTLVDFYSDAMANTVATSETTTSTTYTDLATPGPAVTILTKTSVIVFLSAGLTNAVSGDYALMSVAVSGATTLAAADANCISHQEFSGGSGFQYGSMFLLAGLTAGVNTFTPKYKSVTGGTVTTASNRNMCIMPLQT